MSTIVTPRGAGDWTGTLYFLFQTLVVPSLITVSKYSMQNTKYNYHQSGVLSISVLLSFTYFLSIRIIDIDIYIYHPIHLPRRNAYQTNRNIWYPRVYSTVQKYAKHTGSYSCTFYISVFINVYTLYIYSRLPRPGTMNERDTVHQEPEGMVQYRTDTCLPT